MQKTVEEHDEQIAHQSKLERLGEREETPVLSIICTPNQSHLGVSQVTERFKRDKQKNKQRRKSNLSKNLKVGVVCDEAG